MTCGYCYADMGKFGNNARMMDFNTAKASVDKLLEESAPKSDLVLGYMGGEPLLNRDVVHKTTHYAAERAERTNRKIRFSITTNGTLINEMDAKLFTEFPFTVSVSVDGYKHDNDHIRKMNDGSSSYEHLKRSIKTINKCGRPRHLSARVTVTPKTGDLLAVLDHLIGLGFDEVGFAAVVVSPIPSLAFSEKDFSTFLENMIACAKKAKKEILAGRSYPFGNYITALNQIHKGSHKPYPCGAGAAYMSVNAEGKLYACHRLIDDPKYSLGDVYKGSDIPGRSSLLKNNHVDTMQPCSSCWARYLCGGGCYHEVAKRGRISCDYIRGWLDFCLTSYTEISSSKPEYFYTLDKHITGISNANTLME